MKMSTGMSQAAAESFAVEVFTWLAQDSDRIASFLGWSGESPASLRSRLDDPALLLAVIEFLMMDDAMLIEACQTLETSPETPMRARAALPGGAMMHWT